MKFVKNLRSKSYSYVKYYVGFYNNVFTFRILLIYTDYFQFRVNGKVKTNIIRRIMILKKVGWTNGKARTHWATVPENCILEYWSFDLKCHLMYGAKAATIMLGWVFVITQRRPKLECTIRRRFTNSKWNVIYVQIISLFEQILRCVSLFFVLLLLVYIVKRPKKFRVFFRIFVFTRCHKHVSLLVM